MIACPACHHPAPDGSIFCSECGAQLIETAPATTHRLKPDASEGTTAPINTPATSEQVISLHLLDSGQIISINNKTEFTIGRISDNQPIMPDVDLTTFNAYENGVSRLHTVVRIAQNKISVMDLGSSNGTYINGIRLAPNIQQLIRPGDVVSIGKLKMQILLS